MNKYRDSIDILDSLNYVNYADLSWSKHHVHRAELVRTFCTLIYSFTRDSMILLLLSMSHPNNKTKMQSQMRRMSVLMNKYHQLKDKTEPDWARIAERPHRICTPKQEGTQCGHLMAQFAKHWNGKELVKDREDFHVSYQYIHVE